jgi:hypothetical protein
MHALVRELGDEEIELTREVFARKPRSAEARRVEADSVRAVFLNGD